jgi:hypothetical protein
MPWLEMYFADSEDGNEKIIKKIKEKNGDFVVILNNPNTKETFEKNHLKSLFLDEIISEFSEEGKKIFQDTKNIVNEYEISLSKLNYNKISFFNNIEYFLLLKNFFLMKIHRILSKKMNIIFVFDNYQQMFLSIIKIGEKNGYEIKEIIQFKNKNEIKIIKPEKLMEEKSQIKKKYKKIENKKQISTWIRVCEKAFPLIKKMIEIKIKQKLGENIFGQIKTSIEKKN